jgi:N-acetylglutamate synthase-like GNAT family acetyltransferase
VFNEGMINVRKATVKDKIRIAKLHYTLWTSITNRFVDNLFIDKITCSFFIDKWKNWLTEKNKVTLLAERNKLLLGFITIEIIDNNSTEIQFVYVTHKYRFNSLQKILFDAAFKMAAELGFLKIYFSIAHENKNDLILYKLMKGYTSEEKINNQIFGFDFLEIRYKFDLS